MDCYIDLCLDQLSKNNVKLICGHHYCFECIAEWFKYKNNCPYCRHTLLPTNEDENSRVMNNDSIEQLGICIGR